jgi:signal transduction histidine kinase
MAASNGVPGQRVPVAHTLQGLVRVMQRVHAERQLTITLDGSDERVQFAGEAQDLQEMLGNVLDNACQWAHSAVRIRVQPVAGVASSATHGAIRNPGAGPGFVCVFDVARSGCVTDQQTDGWICRRPFCGLLHPSNAQGATASMAMSMRTSSPT